jgi:hypothetical protein
MPRLCTPGFGLPARLLVGAALLALPVGAFALTIGPDAGGYYATSPYTSGFVATGPPPGNLPINNWLDISATGTRVLDSNTDDGFTLPPIAIGFNFSFYGKSYSNAYISSNGLLSFGQGISSHDNLDLTAPWSTTPSTPDVPAICVWWDDWTTVHLPTPPPTPPDSAIYYQSFGGPDPYWVVTWLDMVNNNASGQKRNTGDFQAILYQSGRIVFEYGDVDIGTAGYSFGRSGTVGIRDSGAPGNGSVLQWTYNPGPTGRLLSNGQAILWTPEPGTLALLALGVVPLIRRRRKVV